MQGWIMEKDEVDINRELLENCINNYMDSMIEQTDFTIDEAQNLTTRDCRIFIKRYEE